MEWRKSSFSEQHTCVEVGAEWHTSSHSGGTNCVEAAGPFTKASHSGGDDCVEQTGCACGAGVLVRDSKDKTGPVLEFSRDEWLAFIAGAKDGEFDL
jgi:hypothetical protein